MLSADAESEALLPLDLPDVDAMKVPHHGSADPGLPEVLTRLRPELAGDRGRPRTTPTATRRRRRSPRSAAPACRTYRTDRDGTVTVTPSDDRLQVETER